tara:strand:+ start:3049 stop:3261 length:213 start_codon:yes stop_codon:yes gene_type:complete
MITFLISVVLIYLFTSPFIDADEIIVSFSKSFLIGVLYNKTFIEDEAVYENVVQFSFVFILISLIWDSKE